MNKLFLAPAIVVFFGCGDVSSNGSSGNPALDGGQPDAKKIADANAQDRFLPATDASATVDAAPAPVMCDGGFCPADFAMKELFLSDSDRNFIASNTAWQTYGDDIDGKSTTVSSTDVCKRVQEAGASIQVDGTGGIDNSWGKNILPLLVAAGFASSPSQTVSDTVAHGGSAVLLKIDGVAGAQDYASLNGGMLIGDPLGTVPLWNGGDIWPVSSLSVSQNDLSMPLAAFPNGSMAGRVYDSGFATGAVPFTISLGTTSVTLTINKMRIHATIATDNSSASLGIVSGVVKTTDMIEAFRQAAGAVSSDLCSGSTFDEIALTIQQASDILNDGTQDNTKDCDAISFGMGFEGSAITFGSVKTDVAPPLPCQ